MNSLLTFFESTYFLLNCLILPNKIPHFSFKWTNQKRVFPFVSVKKVCKMCRIVFVLVNKWFDVAFCLMFVYFNVNKLFTFSWISLPFDIIPAEEADEVRKNGY